MEVLEPRRLLTTWYVANVPTDGNGTADHPFNNVQEAITAAVNNDTVSVGPGTYTGAGNRDINISGKTLTIRSTGGAATTKLDAQGSAAENHRVFQSIRGGAITLDGLTLANGYSGDGAAIWCSSSASLTVLHGAVTGNHSNSWGGAIYVYCGGAIDLEQTTFSQNTAAGHGGAVMAQDCSSLQVVGCTFTNNRASADGGAVRAYNLGGLTVTDSTWTGNHADGAGGAIWAGLTPQFTVNGTSPFTGNNAGGAGGAICLSNITTANFTGQTNLSSNTAGSAGGAVYVEHCSAASFNAATLTGNSSGRNGGAINAYDSASLSIASSTLSGNHANWSGGAIAADVVRQVQVTGGTLSSNTASGSGGGLRLDNCVAATISGAQWTQNTASGDGGAIGSDNNQRIRLVGNNFSGNFTTNGSAGAVMLSNLGQGELSGNNQFLNNHAHWDGGAIYAQYCVSTTIDGATLTGNYADRYGGAMFLGYANVALTNSTVSNSIAGFDGGGVSASISTVQISGCSLLRNLSGGNGGGVNVWASTLTVSQTQLNNNSAVAGGGLAIRGGSQATIANDTIRGNTSSGEAGGVGVWDNSTATFTSDTIDGNSAAGGEGGGVRIANSKAAIDRSVISNNSSLNGSGAGITCYYTNARITNNLIWNNHTSSAGGGLFCNYASPLLEGNVFYNNSSGASGGSAAAIQAGSPNFVNDVLLVTAGSAYADPSTAQIRAWSSSYPLVANTVIWGVGASIASNNGANLCFSDTWDNFAGGTGNLSADPKFVDITNPLGPDGIWGTADDGLRLAASSPCINMGDPAFADSDGTRSDIGAYGQPLPQASRTDWHVSAANTAGPWLGNSVSPFRWIWQAMLVAQAGDTIDVGAGTYSESLPVSTDHLAIRGAGSQSTIIDIQQRAAVFDIVHAQGVEISGFTIAHGSAVHAGGGIRCRYSKLFLHDNVVCDSTNGQCWYGGGLWVAAGSEAHVWNNQFLSNSAQTHGGAIYWESTCTGTLIGNDFYNNSAVNQGGAVKIDGSPIVRNNLFRHNSADYGGAIFNSGAATFVNNTFALNSAMTNGGALYSESSSASIRNSILWGNTAPANPELGKSGGATLTVTYSDIDGTGVWPGAGNLNADPLFANPGAGDAQLADYHLQSQYGRWDPRASGGAGAWVLDTATSPGIDAGDPTDSVGGESSPNGQRINLGAYGGTAQAGKSSSAGLPGIQQPPPSMRGGPTMVLYVDDDAANDPGQNNPLLSDPTEDGSSSHPFDTLQKAIDAAASGATINVLPGLYTGQGNRDLDTRGKTLTFHSTGGASVTTLNAQGVATDMHRIFQSIANGTVTLDGLTITGGYSGNGGAISCSSSASLSVLHCVVTANYSNSWGGAIYVNCGGTIDLEQTTFSQNTAAGRGGAVMAQNCTNLKVIGCTFTSDIAHSDGGAVRVYNFGSFTVTDTTWTGNHADGSGGAIFAQLGSQFTVNGTSPFTGNSANGLGGAICLSNVDTTTITGQTTFSTNTANSHGGAVYLEYCSAASFNAATITSNTSHQNGGAINAYYSDSVSITGGTLSGNHADSSGGAIEAYLTRQVQWSGGTVADNTASGGGGGLRLDNCVAATLSGVSLLRNTATGNSGAIDSDQNQHIRLVDCTFSGNQSTSGSAGAVMFSNLCQGEVTGNNQFLNNHAKYDAGAVYIQYTSLSLVTISGATLTDNKADRYVGAIEVVNQANVVLSGCTISQNSAVAAYGAIIVQGKSIATITGNTISGNQSASLGGALDVYDSTATLQDNTIKNNSSGDVAGAVSVRGGAAITLLHNSLLNNTAASNGGAINADGASAVSVSDNTISGNTSGNLGGGIYAYNCPSVSMTGNTFTGNTGDGIVLDSVSGGNLTNNLVSGNILTGIATIGSCNGVTFSRNLAYGNGPGRTDLYLGIDLHRDGVTLAGLPALNLGSGAANGYVRVRGTAGAGQTIEVFAANGQRGYGEATAYLGSAVADTSGNFSLDVPATNFWVTATATDAAGNTSEFSHLLQTADGTVYVVNTTDDETTPGDGKVSLREAIMAANYDSSSDPNILPGHGADIITFDSALAGKPIRLTGNELVVAPSRLSPGGRPDITIIGLGKGQLAIDANKLSRHFEINPGAWLSMSALTLNNGNAGEGASGGAIYCDGTLDLTNVALTGNSAGTDGGAIYATAKSPAITLTTCDVTGNQAVGNGGGINQQAGTLTISGGNVGQNTAANGGGVYAVGSGSASILAGSFTSNAATSYGGGMYVTKTLTVGNNSSFTSNTAGAYGGGVYSSAGLTANDSTFRTNQALRGAGLYVSWSNSSANLTNVTFSQNKANYDGGAIYFVATTTCELDYCTLDANTVGYAGGAVYLYYGALVARHSQFTNNVGPSVGGAICALSYGTLLIDSDEFTANRAGYSGGAICTYATAVISDSTFAGNSVSNYGGAISNLSGAIQIGSTLFTGNTATSGVGGALYNTVSATILQSTFRSNTASSSGGAIYTVNDDLTFSLSNSLLELNRAGTGGSGSGGAIWSNQRRVQISATVVRSNTATNDGGGIYLSEGFVGISDSLVAGNASTTGRGGGIFVDATGELTFTNSTMSGNAAQQAGGGFYFNDVTNTARFVNATVANNRADSAGTTGQAGGGIYTSTAKILLQNTLVAGNLRGIGATPSDILGLVDSSSPSNLIGDATSSGGLVDSVNHNIVGHDPKLGPLQDNASVEYVGVPASIDSAYVQVVPQTHALPAGSPAIDGGDNALALEPDGDPIWYDQRGAELDRLVGLHVDIGAYEYQQPGGQIQGRKWFDLNQDGQPDDARGLSIAANGGFEQGPAIGSSTSVYPGSTSLAGWQVLGYVQWTGTFWTNAEGGRSVHLYGTTGKIAQVLVTEPGRRYHVQFALAGHPAADLGLKTLRVSAAGTQADFTFDTTAHTYANMGWVTRTWDFVAQETMTNIVFESLTSGTVYGPVIDNVVIQPFGRDDVRVYLDTNNNGVFDAGEPLTFLRHDNPNTATVDETGTYRFTGLPPGQYTVRELLATGFQQIAPMSPNSYSLTIVDQEVHAGLDFGNRWAGEIHGTKFIDLNSNGIRDRNPLPTTSPTVLMVLDVSNTSLRSAGFSIADQNNDGSANTVLDAEIYAMLTVRQELVTLHWGATAQIRVIAFASDAVQMLTTTPAADSNGDGVSDVEDALKSLHTVPSGTSTGKTDYEAALQALLASLTAQAPAGPTVMFFTSDGLSNDPWVLDDELKQLDAQYVDRTAWGFGDNCDLTDLRRIDPYALQLTSTAQIVDKATARSRSGVGDGKWLEPPLAGVTIYLDSNGNGQFDPSEPFKVTAADGSYAFTNLPIGMYTVREVVPAGYVQTAPLNPNYYTVDLRSGPLATGYDFGNVPTNPCSIQGHKGIDTNGNGVLDPGEPYQSGVTFYLDLNGNKQLDSGEPTAVTDATGVFKFLNLAPGNYTVREAVPAGFQQIAPVTGQEQTFQVVAGQTVDIGTFVNQDIRGSIEGFKWLDSNNNGTHDPSEPGLAGIRIYLDTNNSGAWDANEPYAITDQDGHWKIGNVVPGAYTVREVCPTNSQGSPMYMQSPASIGVTVHALEAVGGLAFVNTPILPILVGWKYNDLSGNGQRDRNRLRGNHLIFVVDASDSMRYQFEGDPPGDVNGDGVANDKLDGELAALIAVNQALIDRGLGNTLQISIIAFTNVGYEMIMDPTATGSQWTTTPQGGAAWTATPLADKDHDGTPDVVEVLRSITRKMFGNELRTYYNVALQTVIDTVNALGAKSGDASTLFLSDGQPNNLTNYDGQIAALQNMQVSLNAFGAGRDAILAPLKKIDPDADLFTSAPDLVSKFLPRIDLAAGGATTVPGSADGLWAEPGLAGITVYIDDNNNGRLDWTDKNGNGNWDLGEGERWTVTQSDDPTTPNLDETGRYIFGNLQPGNYIIREIVPADWQSVPLQPYLLDNSAMAYLPFNGNAQDSISGLAATNHGATKSSDRFAQPNRAYAFDGTQWMSVGLADLPVGNAPRTISLWVRSADGQMDFSGEHVAAWGQADTSKAYGVALAWGGQWGAYMHGSADITTGVVPDTSWHQLVVTYDGTTATVFVDGKQKNSASRNLATATGPLVLAVRPDLLANSYFDGSLDDIRIYNRALATNEVAALYTWENSRAVLDDNGYVVHVGYGDTVSDVSFGDRRLPLAWNKGANGNWTDAAWSCTTSACPDATTRAVIASPNTVAVNANASAYSLTVSNGGQLAIAATARLSVTTGVEVVAGTLAGGTITAGAFDLQSGTVTTKLAGQGAVLTKTTSGTIVLSGPNTYSGGTVVLAGKLVVTNPAALPDGSSLTVGADFNMQSTLWSGAGQNALWSNAANWGGASLTATKVLVFNGGGGLSNSDDLPVGTQFNGIVFNANAGAFSLNGNSVHLGGDITNNSKKTQTINLPLVLVGGNRTVNAAAGNVAIAGNISENGGHYGLTKTGSGTLTLSGINSYSGGTTVAAGKLIVANAAALADGANLTVGDRAAQVFASAEVVFPSPTIAPAVAAAVRPAVTCAASTPESPVIGTTTARDKELENQASAVASPALFVAGRSSVSPVGTAVKTTAASLPVASTSRHSRASNRGDAALASHIPACWALADYLARQGNSSHRDDRTAAIDAVMLTYSTSSPPGRWRAPTTRSQQ